MTGGAQPPRRVVATGMDAAGNLRRVRDLVRHAASRLGQARVAFGHGTDNAHDEAVWLVCWVLHLPVSHYAALADASVAWPEVRAVLDLLERRCSERKPLAYLIGEAWLMGYRFRSDERALVPRSLIAEALVDGAMEAHLPAALSQVLPETPARILDLCTGGGSLAVIAASLWPEAEVVASDLSGDALALAAENLATHGVEERVRLVQGDLFAGLGRQRFDLVLCNPPYVNRRSMARLPAEFRAEPQDALAGGDDGMDLVARIVAGAARHLEPDGLLVIEIGHEARHFARRFPGLEWAWIAVARGEDRIVALRAEALRRTAGATADGRAKRQ